MKKTAKLARNLLCDICANLIDFLKNILHSKDFANRHKRSAKDFIRKRLLPFQTLVLYFVNLPKGSYNLDFALCKSEFFIYRLPQNFSTVSALTQYVIQSQKGTRG